MCVGFMTGRIWQTECWAILYHAATRERSMCFARENDNHFKTKKRNAARVWWDALWTDLGGPGGEQPCVTVERGPAVEVLDLRQNTHVCHVIGGIRSQSCRAKPYERSVWPLLRGVASVTFKFDWSSKFNNVHLGLQGRRAMPYSINVSPLTFQSGGIAVSQCMSLATLCLAPLIAHIITGVPEPTYFSRRRPKWHENVHLLASLYPLAVRRYDRWTDSRPGLESLGHGSSERHLLGLFGFRRVRRDGRSECAVLYASSRESTNGASLGGRTSSVTSASTIFRWACPAPGLSRSTRYRCSQTGTSIRCSRRHLSWSPTQELERAVFYRLRGGVVFSASFTSPSLPPCASSPSPR